jgi:hypothetical protein
LGCALVGVLARQANETAAATAPRWKVRIVAPLDVGTPALHGVNAVAGSRCVVGIDGAT